MDFMMADTQNAPEKLFLKEATNSKYISFFQGKTELF